MRTVRPFAAILFLTILYPAEALPVDSGIPRVQGSAEFAGVGFAWGEDGNSFAVARKRDGTAWERLGIPAIALDKLGPGGFANPSPVRVHWEDAVRGWLAWSTRDAQLHIANTADGGTTWRDALAVPTDAQFDGELYPGPGQACLRAQMGEGMMHTTTWMIATGDDGATWSVNRFSGDGVTGWMFRDSSVGFVSTLSPASAEIQLWRTSDGGKTWSPVPMALPSGIHENDIAETVPGSPVFAGSRSPTGTLRISFTLDQGKITVTYRTDDGGLTWTPDKSGGQ